MGGDITNTLPHTLRYLQLFLSSHIMGWGLQRGTGVLVCCVKKLITGNQILSSWKTTVGKLLLLKTQFLNF